MKGISRPSHAACRRSDLDASEARESDERTPFADECASFLAGQWCDEFDDGRPVPVWAWVNQVAHADEATLRISAVAQPSDRRSDRVRSTLARAVLAAADGGRELPDLQRELLVPIELSLMTDDAHSPRHVVELVTAALF